MNNLPKSAISPLVIASKLASADNGTEPGFAETIRNEPRLVGLLWYLQWLSAQPGGLDQFALDQIAKFPHCFTGPVSIHEGTAELTLKQRLELFVFLSTKKQRALIPPDAWQKKVPREEPDPRWDSLNWHDAMAPRAEMYPKWEGEDESKRFHAALEKIAPGQFRRLFVEAAERHLAIHLRSMCEGPAKYAHISPAYCPKLIDLLFDAMDAHAERVKTGLALTQVVALVNDRLDYAWQEKCLVKIEGDARTGKSEAIKAWCFAYPGQARLVATPSSNSLRDLLLAVADVVGLPYTPNVDTSDLKDRVQFVIRHSRLFLIFDEAHWLLPSSYGRNTNPARLDWVRSEIVDKGLPVALVCTPQAFTRGVEKFQKWTGYNFAQFFGRIMLNATLPNELSESDLLAVVKIQGPDIPEKFHRLIAGWAQQSGGYLKTIEAVCSRARYIARRDGHSAVTLADVELTASEVIPATPPPAPPRSAAPPAPARQQPIAIKRGRPIRPAAQGAPMLQGPSREISPPSAPALEMPDREITPTVATA
ncbi:MAG TPA: ATP-binding protein [Verrucomicrobiae bacterium]|jgi:hypothetical protein|nr:ATP-binding protein [Verrucomicrobiae bacterium]